MTINGYTSRNIPDPQIYEDMLERRMAAKKSGDKVTANALKLIANTTYGATLNRYNDLYDPLMARSVCVSGQLYLLELATHLYQDVPGLSVVQTNTDGIMVEFDDTYYPQVKAITDEWQERTGFELEEDRVAKIVQKDVNNYVEIAEDGSIKKKGGYLVRGIAPAGAFNINNNATILATALEEYFVHGTLPEDTIGACDDVEQFMLIAKASSKYSRAYQIIGGEEVPTQKVNRVYAAKDESLGTLYKVHRETGRAAKVGNLPEHCLIDNSDVTSPEHTTIDRIDKQWYIDLAWKRINDFKGVDDTTTKRRKKMATATTKKNAYQKLLEARLKFLESDISKTGKNMQLAFEYFELKDIVPTATKICGEVGLVGVTTFLLEEARMDLINVDDPSDVITFAMPMVQLEHNRGTNAMQMLGAGQTYARRYLWMSALDIAEKDEIDQKNALQKPSPAPAAPANVKTMTVSKTANREEIKEALTDVDGQADDVQIKQLKAAMKKLKEAHPEERDWLARIALDTYGYTKMSRKACAEYLKQIAQKLEVADGK